MIVKIDNQYVVCDQSLPFFEENEGSVQSAFSYQQRYPKLAYVEKALAIYNGGFDRLAGIQDVKRIF